MGDMECTSPRKPKKSQTKKPKRMMMGLLAPPTQKAKKKKIKRSSRGIPHVTGWVYDVVKIHEETENDTVRKLYKVCTYDNLFVVL